MKLRLVIVSLLLALLNLPATSGQAADLNAPKGVSAELWQMYQEVNLWEIDGVKRNLKWNKPVPYFIKGNATQSDSTAVNDNLYKIASQCSNIKPGYSSSEPNEGVILNYLPTARFKEVIPETPASATNSYAMYTYYIKRGLTKFQAVINDGNTDVAHRNYIAHLRVKQGFGFGGFTTNSESTFFVNSPNSTGYYELAEIDKQLISFYCSTLIRSWDSLEETKNYIESIVSKDPTGYANYSNELKVTPTNYGFEINIRPNGDLALQNRTDKIFYKVSDLAGNIVKSGIVDISENVFKLVTLKIDGLNSNKTYKIGLSNGNKRGYGVFQEISERTVNITSSAPNQNSTSGGTQPSVNSKNEALDALNAAKEARRGCENFYDSSNLSDSNLEAVQFILDNSKILNLCSFQDSDLENNEKQIITAKTLDEFNEIIDSLNSIAEALDSSTAELQDALDLIIELGLRFTLLDSLSSVYNDQFELINLKIAKYPSGFKSSLQKSSQWKELTTFKKRIDVAKIQRDKFQSLIENLENTFDLDYVLEDTSKLKSLTPSLSVIESKFTELNRIVPEFLCVKNNSSYNNGKSGKCPVGYKKVIGG